MQNQLLFDTLSKPFIEHCFSPQFDAWRYADHIISLHVDKQHSYNRHDGADC